MITPRRKQQINKASRKWRKANPDKSSASSINWRNTNPDKVKLMGLLYRQSKKSKIAIWKKTYSEEGLEKTCKTCGFTKNVTEFPKTGWCNGIRIYRPSCKACLYPGIRKRKNQLRVFVPYNPETKVYHQKVRKELRDCYIKSLITDKAERIGIKLLPRDISNSLIKSQRRITEGVRKLRKIKNN